MTIGPWGVAIALPHRTGCDETGANDACAACRLIEIEAWNRWLALFTRVPADIWRPQGMGHG